MIPVVIEGQSGFILGINDFLDSCYFQSVNCTGRVFKKFYNRFRHFNANPKTQNVENLGGFPGHSLGDVLPIKNHRGSIKAFWVPEDSFTLSLHTAGFNSNISRLKTLLFASRTSGKKVTDLERPTKKKISA
jgi:hypothetical protein